MSEKFWDGVREENDKRNQVFESRQKEEAERKFRDSVFLAVLPAVISRYSLSVSGVIQHTEDIVDEVMRRRNRP